MERVLDPKCKLKSQVFGLTKTRKPHPSAPGAPPSSGSGGNGYASVDYTVTEDVSAPSSMVGTTHYTQRSEPAASDVANNMINAGVQMGDAVCTMNGYDSHGTKIASGIFIWAVDVNHTYKN